MLSICRCFYFISKVFYIINMCLKNYFQVASTDGWECKSCADTDDPLTCKCSDNMKITGL